MMMVHSRRFALILGCLVGWFTLVAAATPSLQASHPFHVSSAQVNWNSKTGNFEVALCVWPADLEKAIARQQAKPIDLDDVENVDELMQEYIAGRFRIRVPNGSKPGDSAASVPTVANLDSEDRTTAIRWVGHEMDLKKAWLYFEVTGDRQPERWAIENRIFFELNEDQMNQVQVSSGRQLLVADSLSSQQKRIEFETVRTDR